MNQPSTEPLLDATTSGTVDFGGWKTWYRITGDLASGTSASGGGARRAGRHARLPPDDGRPLPVGAPGHSLRSARQRHSTHLRDKGADFWTVDLFLDELENLFSNSASPAGITCSGSHGAGCSGAEHAHPSANRPASLIISDSPASMPLWLAAAAELRAQLPPDVRKHCATRGRRHHGVCRVPRGNGRLLRSARLPHRPPVRRSSRELSPPSPRIPTVYDTMNGPSEFHVIGTLKTWSVVDRCIGFRRRRC